MLSTDYAGCCGKHIKCDVRPMMSESTGLWTNQMPSLSFNVLLVINMVVCTFAQLIGMKHLLWARCGAKCFQVECFINLILQHTSVLPRRKLRFRGFQLSASYTAKEQSRLRIQSSDLTPETSSQCLDSSSRGWMQGSKETAEDTMLHEKAYAE